MPTNAKPAASERSVSTKILLKMASLPRNGMNVTCGAMTYESFAVWSANAALDPICDGDAPGVGDEQLPPGHPPVWLTLMTVSTLRGAYWLTSFVSVVVSLQTPPAPQTPMPSHSVR